MASKANPAKLSAAELPLNLDPLAAVVLGALPGATAEQRDALSGGEHEVHLDITLHIDGVCRIGAGGIARQANLLPWQEMAMLFANELPQAKVDEVIARGIVITQRGRDSVEAEALKAEAEDLKARVEAAFEQAGAMIEKERRGSVRLLGDIDVKVRDRS